MDSIWSSSHRCKQRNKRPRYYKTPVAYYSNSIAIQRLVQTATSSTQKSKEKTNAKRNITKFDCCEKTIRRNQASITCCGCIGSFLKCSGLTASSSTWLCSNCLGFALPFYKCSEAKMLDDTLDLSTPLDPSLDIHLLCSNSGPGSVAEFRNREGIRGGGVGVYIKENINYKRRHDIENAHPELEHLWIKAPGRNKYSRALVGVICNSERMLSPSDWLNSLDNLLGYLTVYWDGMLMLTGDINIDMLRPSDHLTKRYQGILDLFELTQIVERPTRATRTSKTLIDHFITNHPQR